MYLRDLTLDSESNDYRRQEKKLRRRIRSLEQEVIKLQLENSHLAANASSLGKFWIFGSYIDIITIY